MLKRFVTITLGVAVLATSCTRFLPSDPGGRLGTVLTPNGSAAILIPTCGDSPTATLSSVTVALIEGDELGRQVWTMTAKEPQTVSSQYVLGDVPAGFTASAEWEKSYVDGPVNIRIITGDGLTLTSDATFGQFQPGSLYISNTLASTADLQNEIYCGSG